MTIRTIALMLGVCLAVGPTHAQKREREKREKPAATKADEPSVPALNRVEVTLRDAVKSALAYSPLVTDISVTTGIARAEAQRQEGRLGSVLSLSTFGRQEKGYNEFPLSTGTPSLTRDLRSLGGEAKLDGRTSFGGQYQLRMKALISRDTASLESGLSPRYQSEVALRYNQPLRRGLGTVANRGLVRRELLGAAVAEGQGRERLRELVLEVVTAYWNLALQREGLRISEANLTSAGTLREVVERRVRAGRDARSALVQADATVAERRQAVNIAAIAVIQAEQELLRISYLPRTREITPKDAVIPADAFTPVDKGLEYGPVLAAALAARPELKRVKDAIRLAELDREIAENATRWRVDLYGDVGLLGLGGSPTSAGLPAELDGNLQQSLQNLGRAKAPFFEVGLLIEIPFDNGDADGAARQATLRLERQKAADVETVIAVEVRAALQQLAISRRSLEVAAEALELAEQNVAAQRRQYEGGGGTLFDVLRAQDERSAAEGELARARAQHEVSRAGLDAARGQLLSQFGTDGSR